MPLGVSALIRGEICIGSAGGFEAYYRLPVTRTPVSADSHTTVSLRVLGLVGGHTGGDIHVC